MIKEYEITESFIRLAIIYLLMIFCFMCCDTDEIIEEFNKCESIELEYNSKVVTMALQNGWDPQSYEFNSTTIGAGFLDPFHDPNFKIFLEAYETYRVEWEDTLTEFNCN